MPLSSDLVPYISDPSASLILASIASARWVPAPDDSGMENGTLQFRVEELFSDTGPKPGELLTITAQRYGDPEKRQQMGFDAWNTLSLQPGNALVMAVRRIPTDSWIALAAEGAPAGDTTLVAAVRRAREIEKQPNPVARVQMLREALNSPQDLLFQYALDAIGRRGRAPRDEAARIIVEALLSNGRANNAKLSLVQQLTRQPIYEDQRGADPVNRMVIGSVARVLAMEGEPEWSLIWTQFLAVSLLPAFSADANKDREIRQTLIRAVPERTRRQVPEVLAKAAQQRPTDPRIPKLLEAWKAALQ
jgi:hypothetical protein